MPSRGDRLRIAVGTRSAHKLEEIRAIFGVREDIELLGLDDLGIPPSPAEEGVETFDTFIGNARAKAAFYASRTGLPTLADDSGLAVDALGGAPGVRSKRFSGRTDLSGAALDRANNELLLERLGDTPDERRGARFVCVAALAFPNGRTVCAIGTVAGRIAREPRGRGGFGYDPLFLLPDLGVTFSELSPDEKNRRSHRARAFRALAAHVVGLLKGG